MKNRNICKSIDEENVRDLTVVRFICINETNMLHRSTGEMLRTDRMLLVTEGSGTLTVNNRSHRIETGMVAFIFAGQKFRIGGSEDIRYLYIDYFGIRTMELYAKFGIGDSNYIFPGFRQLIPIWKESLIRANSETLDLLSESMLLYAFSQFSCLSTEDVGTVQMITEYLSDHFSDNALTLKSMADELGYNSSYLSQLISSKMGVNFSEYVTELRLRHAVLLISQGVTLVKNIALLCGFSDPLYFSRVFKEKFNLSPRAFIAERAGAEAAEDEEAEDVSD